jgi:hypothetical protein
MRNLRLAFPFLLATMALASNALSQTDNPHATNELPSLIVTARCQYTPTENACAELIDSAQPRSSANAETTLAQLPRQMPRPPFRTGRLPMGRPGYPGMWRAAGSPAHALIGTLIGFGLGAAVGAKGNTGVRGSFVIGMIGAGIGAGIGLSLPSFPSRNPYWHRWPSQDDDEEASRRKTTQPDAGHPDSPQETASVDKARSRLLPRTADRVPPRSMP